MQIFNIQKLAIVTAILVTVSVLLLFSLHLTVPLNYPDFISGHVAWFATTKFQDLVVMPIVLAGGFLQLLFLIRLFRELNIIDLEMAQKSAFHIILWSLPAISVLCGFLMQKGLEHNFLAISAIGVVILTTYAQRFLKRRIPIEIEKVSIGLLMVFFFSLVPLCLSVVINILPFRLTGGSIGIIDIKNWTFIFFLVVLLLFVYFINFKSELYCKNLPKFIFLGQLGLVLLFFTIYPARLLEEGSNLTSYETSIFLKILLAVLVMLSIGDVILRFIKYRNSELISKCISPFVIIALILATKFGNTSAPGISPDDYHFGEHLLGWWTYLQGYMPYIDFMPAHGVINNDFAGFLNIIFYDGTAASLLESQRLANALLASIAFLSIYATTKSLLISFISIYFLDGRMIWLFLIPFAALWFHRPLIEDKVRWSVAWFITAPLVILGVPPQGLLLVAATGVIPIYFLIITHKNRDWLVIKPVVFWFSVISIFYGLTPLGEMLISAAKYVLVNGPINQVAYGIPWSVSLNGKAFLFEMVRMSWVLVPGLMLCTLYFLFQNKRFKPHYFLPLISVFIFALLLMPYSMGRIDPGSASRPGWVGVFLICGFLSMVLWNILGQLNRIWLVLGVVALASLMKLVPISLSPLLSSASAYIKVSELKESPDQLLANIGRSQVSDQHWQRLNRLALLLDEMLEPNESYLDLTSRNAQYFYLDRKPLIRDTALYNMASFAQQSDAIKRLEKKLPRLALLEGQNIIHDGGGVALRNHYLYRFVIEHYEPFEKDGFVIGLSKEALERGDWNSLTFPDLSLKMELFEKAFSRRQIDLRKLPVAWGRSIDSLSKKMRTVLEKSDFKVGATHHIQVKDEGSYEVVGHDPFIVFNLSPYKLSGQDVGVLKFDFKCTPKNPEPRIPFFWLGDDPKAVFEEGNIVYNAEDGSFIVPADSTPRQEPKIQVFWWGDSQDGPSEQNSLFFDAEDGTLIVPIDAAPRWYLLNTIEGVRIDLHNADACKSFSLKGLSLNVRG